jgi:hypothetical protein
MVVGPVMTGFLYEATGDLRLPLIIASLSGLILVPVGALIALAPPQSPEPESDPVSGTGLDPIEALVGDKPATAGAEAASK